MTGKHAKQNEARQAFLAIQQLGDVGQFVLLRDAWPEAQSVAARIRRRLDALDALLAEARPQEEQQGRLA